MVKQLRNIYVQFSQLINHTYIPFNKKQQIVGGFLQRARIVNIVDRVSRIRYLILFCISTESRKYLYSCYQSKCLQFLLYQIMEEQPNELFRKYFNDYHETKKCKAIKVGKLLTNLYHKSLKQKQKVLDIPNMDRIIDCQNDNKLILVNDDTMNQDLAFGNADDWKFTQVQIQITQKQCTTQELFNMALKLKKQPQQIPYPNSFETIGHIAHYNLTPQQAKYKQAIGEITLLKCPNIKTVVNKTEKLHNVYRTPTLQMMAGEQNYVVRIKQVGAIFQLDFQKVYWCSRLQQERDRLLKKIKPGQLLADIFCGVGPLAVRAAIKGIYVIANDLNPECFRYLQINSKLNKVQDKMICWNMCARQAMRKIYREKESFPEHMRYPDHIYMNLPVDAIEFLDVFVDYAQQMKTNKMPLIHVNCFVVANSDEQSKQKLLVRIGKILPSIKEENIKEMHRIKNVTVIMRMYCVTLSLPNEEGDQIKKKIKL